MSETERLIQDCIRGDRGAQGRLYQLYATKMLRVCLRYAKNKEEAEDILQEGFMKVFTGLRQFNFKGSFEGWIRKITKENKRLQKTSAPVGFINERDNSIATSNQANMVNAPATINGSNNKKEAFNRSNYKKIKKTSAIVDNTREVFAQTNIFNQKEKVAITLT